MNHAIGIDLIIDKILTCQEKTINLTCKNCPIGIDNCKINHYKLWYLLLIEYIQVTFLQDTQCLKPDTDLMNKLTEDITKKIKNRVNDLLDEASYRKERVNFLLRKEQVLNYEDNLENTGLINYIREGDNESTERREEI